MKNLLYSFLFFLLIFHFLEKGFLSNASKDKILLENLEWLTWEKAVERLNADKKSGKKGKKLMIDVYTDWCGWCKKMDKETFQDPEISKYLSQNFYLVKLNAEQKENIVFNNNTFKFVPQGNRGYHELAAALLDGKMSYPSLVFMNENLERITIVPGFMNPEGFQPVMKYIAEEHYLTTKFEDYQKRYKK